MVSPLFEGVFNHPRRMILLFGLLTLASLFALLLTGVDNALEVWLMKDTPAFDDYSRFTKAFGSEEFILVAIEGPGIFSPDGLEVLKEATLRAGKVKGVKSALSASVIIEALDLTGPIARKIMLAVPTYRRLLTSDDGKVAGLILAVNPESAKRPEIVAALESTLQFVEGRGYRLLMGGPPVLQAELNRLSTNDPSTLFPIVLAVSVLLLALLFRSLAGVLVPLCCLFVTVVGSMAFVGVLGQRLNMITVTFPAVLWVLGLSQAVHLLAAYGRNREAGLRGGNAVAAAVAEIRYPCLLMSVTTAAGFLSLLFSEVGPVRELGFYTAGGILFGFLVNILLGPSLLLLKGPRSEGLNIHPPRARALFTSLVSWIRKYRILILSGGGLLMAIALLLGAHIKVETNALKFLRPGNPLLEDFTLIQDKLIGLSSLEIDVERPTEEDLAVTLEKIRAFSGRVTESYPICRLLSVEHLLRAAAFHATTPGSMAEALSLEDLRTRAESIIEEAGPESLPLLLPVLRVMTDVSTYITGDSSRLRISIFAPALKGSTFIKLRKDVQQIASDVFGSNACVTGIVPLLIDMQWYLVTSQVQCLASALLIIFVFMVLAARSFRLGLVSMLPNVFPFLLNFGIMGLLVVRLDAATMMIASVALGIAVDNTIHMIVVFRRFQGEGLNAMDSLEKTVQWKGWPILCTTLVTCTGFMVLGLSDFLPMAWFGGLTAFTILWAMVGDLLILPALLVPRKR